MIDRLLERLKQLEPYKIPLAISFVGLVLIVGSLFSSNIITPPKSETENFPKESLVTGINSVKADIAGAVVSPGIYSLTGDSRLADLIRLAGGFRQDADKNYIAKQVNLSQKISDGQKIYIPKIGESSPTYLVGVSNGSGQIGLNSATSNQLESLSGIGPVTAQKIIQARPFQTVEDLLTKKVVSKSVYAKIKDQLTIN